MGVAGIGSEVKITLPLEEKGPTGALAKVKGTEASVALVPANQEQTQKVSLAVGPSLQANGEQIVKVMLINPPKAEEKGAQGWNWGKIAKYTAITAATAAVGYYGYVQLSETLQMVEPIVKTAHRVVTKGIPTAMNTLNKAIKATDEGYYKMGKAVADIRSMLNSVGVETPPLPVDREDTIQLGTELVNNGWVWGGVTAANAAYLTPLLVPIALIFPKAGPVTGATALTSMVAYTAMPETFEKYPYYSLAASTTLSGLTLFTFYKCSNLARRLLGF